MGACAESGLNPGLKCKPKHSGLVIWKVTMEVIWNIWGQPSEQLSRPDAPPDSMGDREQVYRSEVFREVRKVNLRDCEHQPREELFRPMDLRCFQRIEHVDQPLEVSITERKEVSATDPVSTCGGFHFHSFESCTPVTNGQWR